MNTRDLHVLGVVPWDGDLFACALGVQASDPWLYVIADTALAAEKMGCVLLHALRLGAAYEHETDQRRTLFHIASHGIQWN